VRKNFPIGIGFSCSRRTATSAARRTLLKMRPPLLLMIQMAWMAGGIVAGGREQRASFRPATPRRSLAKTRL
jgi:hypothetical protein